MAPFAYSKSVEDNVVTENEMKRLACIMMHLMDDNKVLENFNWDACAKDFKAAPGGFRRMFSRTVQKLREGKHYYVASDDDTPKKATSTKAGNNGTKKATTAGKRKAATSDGEDDDGTPAKVKKAKAATPSRGGRKKSASVAADDDAGDSHNGVKMEEDIEA